MGIRFKDFTEKLVNFYPTWTNSWVLVWESFVPLGKLLLKPSIIFLHVWHMTLAAVQLFFLIRTLICQPSCLWWLFLSFIRHLCRPVLYDLLMSLNLSWPTFWKASKLLVRAYLPALRWSKKRLTLLWISVFCLYPAIQLIQIFPQSLRLFRRAWEKR